LIARRTMKVAVNAHPCDENNFLAAIEFKQKDAAEAEACGHDRNPRHERVADNDD
jgi:hypothetical protein